MRQERKEARRLQKTQAEGGTERQGQVAMASNIITRKRGPERPPKRKTLAKIQAELRLQQQQWSASEVEAAYTRTEASPSHTNYQPNQRFFPPISTSTRPALPWNDPTQRVFYSIKEANSRDGAFVGSDAKRMSQESAPIKQSQEI